MAITKEKVNERQHQPLSTTMDENAAQEPIVGSNGSAAKDAFAGNKIFQGAEEPIAGSNGNNESLGNNGAGTPVGATGIMPHKEPEATGMDRSIKAYRDWLEAEQYRPETKEEREKRERKERSKRIIASVGDGISALSNLFFATHYAPSSYKHETGLSTNLEKHLDKLKAERQQKADRYYNYAIQLGRLEAEKERLERDQKRQDKADELRNKAAGQADQRFQWEMEDRPWARARKQSEADYAKARADKEAAAADNAAALEAEKLRSQKAQTQQRRAAAGASAASAAAHNRSNPMEYSAWDENGKEHKFKEKAAAERFARQHGTWQDEEVRETTNTTRTQKTPSGREKTNTTSATKVKEGGYPARPSKYKNTSQLKW